MWILQGKEIKNIEDLPEGLHGFVYIIYNKTLSKWYIGKKNLWSTTKKALTKKEIEELPRKNSKKYKYVTKESDWKLYNGSCKELIEDIRMGHEIEKEILFLCPGRISLSYNEVRLQFLYNCLLDDSSYNQNILGKFYKGNIE